MSQVRRVFRGETCGEVTAVRTKLRESRNLDPASLPQTSKSAAKPPKHIEQNVLPYAVTNCPKNATARFPTLRILISIGGTASVN